MALAAITAYAYDFETEGLCFSLMSNGELSVAGLGSSQGEYYRNGKLTIPDVVTYGREYKEFPAGDGVETVSIDALDPAIPVEIYDLHGRRLGSDLGAPPSGIYLVKQGARLSKVAR